MVSVRLYLSEGDRWELAGTYRAKLGNAETGTTYTRRLSVPAEGRYAVRVFHYRSGKLVAKSALARSTWPVGSPSTRT